ncbi:MAG: pyruvate ferredoxin oxidoreductase [Candidatus Sigynarchaeum springense]
MSVKPMGPFFEPITKKTMLTMTGNYAVAGAVKQTDPDVICAFPITPQTQSVEGLSDVVYEGALKAAFVNTESELAAMSYSIAAALTGARVFTATASQGYLLMQEALPMAVGWRLPISMLISARAWNAPNLNIWNSWEFTLADHGWNAIVSENVQESYDSAIMAVMIAEKSLFPTMFVHDGFITSHAVHKYWALPDDEVLKLVPKKKRHFVDVDNPATWGGLVTPEYLMEQRYATIEAKKDTSKQIDDVFAEFGKASGRQYKQVETRNIEGKKTAFLTMGSMCGNIASWQLANPDIGLIKLRTWRPFPAEYLRKVVEQNKIERIAVIEKDDAPGAMLPQVSQSVYDALGEYNVAIRGYTVGLGGRDVTADEFNFIKSDVAKISGKRASFKYVGLRESTNKVLGVDKALNFSSHVPSGGN